jgi:hypothetical protein
MKIKKLIEKIEWLRDWANKECLKYDDGVTTYGDTERLASDVEYGRIQAFDEVLEIIEKLKNSNQ